MSRRKKFIYSSEVGPVILPVIFRLENKVENASSLLERVRGRQPISDLRKLVQCRGISGGLKVGYRNV